TTPEIMFSADQFHPSAAAYALAAEQLLAGLGEALGEKMGGATLPAPSPSGYPTIDRGAPRPGIVSRLWRGSALGPAVGPAPAGPDATAPAVPTGG
ncbi:MAG: hypothetical protein WCB92_18795, partial [Mycobacterium sp.]